MPPVWRGPVEGSSEGAGGTGGILDRKKGREGRVEAGIVRCGREIEKSSRAGLFRGFFPAIAVSAASALFRLPFRRVQPAG